MIDDTLLCDVDGVVADLNEGFCDWLEKMCDIELKPEQIVRHSASALGDYLPEVNNRMDALTHFKWDKNGCPLGKAFDAYMSELDVYQRWVSPNKEAKRVLLDIASNMKVVFVTANMKKIPMTYVSKYNWLQKHFPGIPVVTCPSDLKHMVKGELALDDRYDICERYAAVGTTALCPIQPWNEVPTNPDPTISIISWDKIHDRLQTYVSLRNYYGQVRSFGGEF